MAQQRQNTSTELARRELARRELPIVRPQTDEILTQMGVLEMRNFILAQAAVFKVDAGLLRIPENVGEIVKAVQYTRHYGFMPGVDLHMQSFRSKVKRVHSETGKEVEVWEDRLSLVVGEQAYKKSAQIQANQARDWIDVPPEVLDDAEAAEYITRNYPDAERHANDRVARARVLSVQAINLYKSMGLPYDPEYSYGVCLWLGTPKVWEGKKTYPKADRDRIPNQRTPEDVAKRRAIKAAIMQKYGLVPLDNRTPEQRMAQVMTMAQPDIDDPRARMPIASKPRGTMDDDIDELWAQAQAANAGSPLGADAQGAPVEPEDGEYRETDAETVADDSEALTDAHERLNDVGVETFGLQWAQAQSWLIRRYTETNTPGSAHDQIIDLTPDQCDDLADKTVKNRKRYQAGWKAHQATQPA